MNTKLCGKIASTLLCAALLAQYCAGMTSKSFKYRRPLTAQLYQEYEAMSRTVMDAGISALLKFEDEISHSLLNTSSVEVQEFVGLLTLARTNIAQTSSPSNLFKLLLLQEQVQNLLQLYHSKTPGLLQKDFGVTIEEIAHYQQTYLNDFTTSVSGFIHNLSASRRKREQEFVDWFQKFAAIEGHDSKMEKVYEFFEDWERAEFEKVYEFFEDYAGTQKGFIRREDLDEYIIEQYERLLTETYHWVNKCREQCRESNYQSRDKIVSSLNFLDQFEERQIKYPRLRLPRTVFKQIYVSDFQQLIQCIKHGESDPAPYCLSIGQRAHDELDSFIKTLAKVFDNFFENESSDPLRGPSSLYFVWFERFDGQSGLEQLRTVEEYIAGINLNQTAFAEHYRRDW